MASLCTEELHTEELSSSSSNEYLVIEPRREYRDLRWGASSLLLLQEWFVAASSVLVMELFNELCKALWLPVVKWVAKVSSSSANLSRLDRIKDFRESRSAELRCWRTLPRLATALDVSDKLKKLLNEGPPDMIALMLLLLLLLYDVMNDNGNWKSEICFLSSSLSLLLLLFLLLLLVVAFAVLRISFFSLAAGEW
jgi:hypothetical protein